MLLIRVNASNPLSVGEYRLKEPSRPDQEFGIEEDEIGTYLLNSKDLNMLAHLEDLRKCGCGFY